MNENTKTKSDPSLVENAVISAEDQPLNPASLDLKIAVIPVRRLWLAVFIAGITAGIVSWLIGEGFVETFKPEMHQVEKYGMVTQLPTRASVIAAEIKNAALAFAVLGGVLGVALGLAGGLANGNLRGALKAAAVGLAFGALTGVAASYLLVPIFQERFDMVGQGLAISLLVHGAIWSAIGAVGGLALGIGLGGWDRIGRCLVGGLGGGILGTMIYELIGAFMFPLDKTYLPLSETASSRLLARLAITVCVAVAAVAAIRLSRRTKS